MVGTVPPWSHFCFVFDARQSTTFRREDHHPIDEDEVDVEHLNVGILDYVQQHRQMIKVAKLPPHK